MQIVEPGQPIPVDHPVILLVGEWGIGKSSIGSSLDTTLIDFDEGASRAVNRRHVALVRRWSDVNITQLRGRKAVTIDTVEGCLKLLQADILRNAKYGTASLNQLGWAELLRRFGAFLGELRAEGLDVLLLAHAKPVRDESGKVRVAARIPGGSYHEVMRLAHVVGYLHLRNNRRVIDFELTDRFQGKNPGQWPLVEVPPIAEARSFMAAMFDQARGVLGAAERAQAAAVATVATWRAEFQAIATPAQFREALAQLQRTKASVSAGEYAQLQHLFRARMAAVGVEWGPGGFRAIGRPTPMPLPSQRTTAWQQPAIEFAQEPLGRRRVA